VPTISCALAGALEVIATIALIMATVLLGVRYVQTSSGAAHDSGIQDVAVTRVEAKDVINVTGVGDFAILEFSDYECPYCGAYARDVFPSDSRSSLRPSVLGTWGYISRYAAILWHAEQARRPSARPNRVDTGRCTNAYSVRQRH